MAAKQLEELTGIYETTRWRAKDDSNYTIGLLDDGIAVCGTAEEGALIPGCSYLFRGRWDESAKFGKQFKFVQFVQREPASRHGLVHYLARYAPGIGPVIAGQLYDAFGGEACKVLRTKPELAVSAAPRLTIERAHAAARALQALAALEETKIELTNLFAGRGFPGLLVDACCEKWGILAPRRVRRDPFTLLVNKLPGCGFLRCDRLYMDLGHNPGKLKRQMICLWHALNSDTSGNTWIPESQAIAALEAAVSGAKLKPEKALALGVRARWLARLEHGQERWIADYERAKSERELAEQLIAMGAMTYRSVQSETMGLRSQSSHPTDEHEPSPPFPCVDHAAEPIMGDSAK